MSVALSAVGTVASGALSGAGGEVGRRASERLHGLLGRGRAADGGAGAGSGGGEERPTLPVTEQEQRAAALRLVEVARRSPEAAREVAEWVREASWLAPRAVPAVADGASRPQMLPPTTSAFTDREDVTAWITALLDGAGPVPGAPVIAALTGPGGIGKTAVAVQCAYALRERFPDGILFVDLAGASAGTALPPSDVLARFLERLGVPPAMVPGDEARQRDLFRDCTADRRMMVVLDNAHSDAQVVPLLPASSGCLVLVTSRHRLGRLVAEHGARPRVLGPLSTADSVLLLRRVAGNERAAAPDAVVEAVAEAAGGVPLALCTTGAGLAVREHLAWERVARQLSEREQSADDAGGSVDPVRQAQDAAYRELAPECAAFYRALAVWAWPTVTVMCAARAADVEEERARALLEELARVHLLEEVGEERYRFHDLARVHARERAVEEDGHGRMAAGSRSRMCGGRRRRTCGSCRCAGGSAPPIGRSFCRRTANRRTADARWRRSVVSGRTSRRSSGPPITTASTTSCGSCARRCGVCICCSASMPSGSTRTCSESGPPGAARRSSATGVRWAGCWCSSPSARWEPGGRTTPSAPWPRPWPRSRRAATGAGRRARSRLWGCCVSSGGSTRRPRGASRRRGRSSGVCARERTGGRTCPVPRPCWSITSGVPRRSSGTSRRLSLG
ncbi:hypothetical protein KVH02_11885 [Streptomyces olivaceus]|uniref:AAA+ ATPase domain-containing protein n=1 Tax=Streptomyces olivaceus TaxID=47716 RepID=A0ABS7W1N0_STROV|nr:hypothetical protein [Streptomyces olivaceus]MBZ6095609.1 hypothetical protein [Streptomyces olivaceus]MBZ6119878.1 hypothetical protein [Streptomyces olivaceus]MBZ6151429.1 hypothetical protein [Streptomyces olivaceus]MBZ6298449.1 hypothetical protein [Streptomyces olivaceus]